MGQFKKQALNLEVQLQDFFDTCAKQPECAIAKDGSPGANFDHIFATVNAHPLVIDGGETITASQGKTVVATTLWRGESAARQDPNRSAIVRFVLLTADRFHRSTHQSALQP